MKKIKMNDEVYVGDSDKRLKDYLSDTGWVNCTLSNSKFRANWFKTRKIGDIVMISGQFHNLTEDTISSLELIGTTPYPPKEEVFNSCRIIASSATEQNSLIYITTDGRIQYMGPSHNSSIQFSFTYFVN